MYRSGKLFSLIAAMICATLLIISSASVTAQETEDALEGVSLGDLLNLEVTVATKTSMTLEDAPSIVSVITGDEIRNTGARNLKDVLRTVPGFDFNHAISTPQDAPFIRGVSGGVELIKSKILINGDSVYNIAAMLSYIPIRNIRQIEIIRGPGSALYGTGAFAGVINIITRKGGESPSSLGFEAGSYDTFASDGEFSYKKEDISVYFFASVYKTDGYDGIIKSDMTSNVPVLASAAPGEMTSDAEALSAQTYISYKNLYFQGMAVKLDSNNPVGVADALADEDDMDDFLGSCTLGYRLPVSEKGDILFKAFYNKMTFDRLWEVFPEETAEMEIHTGFPPGEGVHGNPRAKHRTTGAEITGDFEVFPGLEIVGGVSYTRREQYDTKHYANTNVANIPIEVNGVTYPPFLFTYFPSGLTDISDVANWNEDAERDIYAGYLQGILSLKQFFSLEKGVEALALTLGGRFDHYSDFGNTFNPRAGLVYAPFKDLYFKALYGTAFRAPEFGQMHLKNNPDQAGNPDIDPETIETMEFLTGFNFAEHFSGTVTCYKTGVDDMISVVDRKWNNHGEMEGYGLEAEFKFRFAKNKYAYFNVTWQDMKNTTNDTITSEGGQIYTREDFNPGSIPELMGNLGVNWEFGRYVNANLSLNYVGEKDRSEEKIWAGEELVLRDQRDPVDARTLVNASLTFRNFCKGLEIQLSGFNIFDEDHRSPDPAGSLYYDMPEPGRWFTGRISYSF
ncbi:TonB-dependent receptor [Desulfococcaceae bacterium HSG8]|nr:TonB-dependent receptor [Desulfococcaceae bacterium HSG8]